MNYFAHGRHFIDQPYYLAGTAVPDWLNVVDRRVRVRRRHSSVHLHSPDATLAAVAAGIAQHCSDDDWFHQTQAFAELSLDLCHRLREVLPADDGFRPHFLGHILVELLLDAQLISEMPDRLEAYYTAIEAVDPQAVQSAVERIAGREVPNLAAFIPLFARERFLWDYTDDAKLLFRLNQVMRRVGLPLLPLSVGELFGHARREVSRRQAELLVA